MTMSLGWVHTARNTPFVDEVGRRGHGC